MAADASFVAAVVVLNAVIRGYQEWKAERSGRALQTLLRIRAAVLRDERCGSWMPSSSSPGTSQPADVQFQGRLPVA
jgi:magnesium-transporting ATPase (P-type)